MRLLTPEYAVALADEGSPYFVASYFQVVQATMSVAPKVAEAFRPGGGITQADYPPWMFEATERNSLPRYQFKLARKWLPAMPQVVERLQSGQSGQRRQVRNTCAGQVEHLQSGQSG